MIGQEVSGRRPGVADFIASPTDQDNLAVANRVVGVRDLVSGLSPGSARRIQERLEPLLIDDPELLLSLRLHLEQARAQIR